MPNYKQYEANRLEVMNNIGASLARLGRYKESLEYFDKVLEINPEYELVKNNREIVQRKLDKKHTSSLHKSQEIQNR